MAWLTQQIFSSDVYTCDFITGAVGDVGWSGRRQHDGEVLCD